MRRLHKWMVLLGVAASAAMLAGAPESRADEAQFKADLDALTKHPHRLSGTPEGKAAGDYIIQRLQAIGLDQLLTLEFPMVQTKIDRCEIEVDGAAVPVLPLRPNLIANPVTPPEGIAGPMLYAGSGTMEAVSAALQTHGDVLGGAQTLEGMIVVLDYDCFDNWEVPFSLGAQAIVFLGNDESINARPLHAGVPGNLVRLYAHADADGKINGVDLRQPRPRVTVYSHVTWQNTVGRNIIGLIKGTDPAFGTVQPRPEMMVLAAHYDSFGNVPQGTRGARDAANVAALLETAAAIRDAPPKRDTVLLFVDHQARAHQGAREFYSALLMSDAVHTGQITAHTDEREFNTRALELLQSRGFDLEPREEDDDQTREVIHFLEKLYTDQADWARDSIQSAIQTERMRWIVSDNEVGRRTVSDAVLAERDAASEAAIVRIRRWDDIRRALHEGELHELVHEIDAAADGRGLDGGFGSMALNRARNAGGAEAVRAEARAFQDDALDELKRQTTARMTRRLRELAVLARMDSQRTALRFALGNGKAANWITVHTTFNFGDASATWGPVIGDWSAKLFNARTDTSADSSGFYVRLLAALRETVGEDPQALGIEPQTLRDTDFGWSFVPGRFFSSGTIAGQYKIYNFSLMTGYDARLRDGHPADTVANLDWQRLRRQAVTGGGVMHRFADNPNQSQPRRFSATARNKWTTWSRGRSTGEYAGLKVTGGLSERRPAAGALMAIWPGAMVAMQPAVRAPGFCGVIHEAVDANGNFTLVSVRRDVLRMPSTLGGLFDPVGQIRAITSQESLSHPRLTDAIRTDLFLCKPKVFTYRPTFRLNPPTLKILRANANSVFRAKRFLSGQVGAHSAFFISQQVIDDRTKVFQPMGPAVLGPFTKERPSGAGVEASRFNRPPWLTPLSAASLLELNESRLRRLSERGVGSADLELMHARAGRVFERADAATDLDERDAGFGRAQMLSHRVYRPLRTSMDDLVHSIVVLLLLAIPFAFSMERLVIGASSIYGRIGGFTVMFLVTFALLYWLHPGFAIASTPIIIFLAFAIILLSALVIYIVVRKFQSELKVIQGQTGGAHDLEVSKAGAMLAAISMGISTMRRRPTRTLLTAITVVMLTFTILCFASFTTEIGVRSIYEGPVTEGMPDALTLRNIDYAPIEEALPDLLNGQEGEGGMLAEQWWLVPLDMRNTSSHFAITRPGDGKSEKVNAVMGIDPAEIRRWPALAGVLQPAEELADRPILGDDDVYLPPIIINLMDLKPGQRVLVQGVEATVRGQIDSDALQRLRRVDGEPALPVDFLDEANTSEQEDVKDDSDEALVSDVQRDFVYLSADQVAICSNALARELGGGLHVISLYPGDGVTAVELGRDIAQAVVMPVWAPSDQGVERMILTRLTAVAGGMRLAVPLLLGGLIIFGTLLGSISDREKEIYTFSALGLSPGHVGVLFFAEATVYAFVGGMGGQLLAQFVALGATQLTRAGLIDPVSINYSSTNSLFAIGVVMATVIVSAIYPAIRASKSANPGLARAWKMPKPEDDDLKMVFPFTVSAYDITGIVAFLGEHFRRHDDAGLGDFAASNVEIGRDKEGSLQLSSDFALAPFDLGVTQRMTLTAVESEIPGVDEVAIHAARLSGAKGDWYRANRVFVRGLRRQFLLWRTLGGDVIEQYRMETLQTLGEIDADDIEHTQPASSKQKEAGHE